MPYSIFTNLGLGELDPTKLIVDLADRTIKHPKGIAENVLVGIDKFVFPVDFLFIDMPEDIKVPLILERPFLSTAHAKIDVFKRKITLKVRNDKIVFKSDKPTSNIIKRVYALGLMERMELDLEARLMGEALILNRSLDLTYGDYIEPNDLDEPLELKINQVEELGPTIKDGEVIDKPMIEVTKTRNNNEEIEIKWNMGEYVMKAFINVPIFVENFSVVTNFAIVEDMDAYRDQGMGDVIVGKLFCREMFVKAKRFDGMITIYNGNNDVTYQMARSHPRFKHVTNAQCNKMRPLLKISARDQLSGISYPYQNLKSFYKGVLNLEPKYIKDAKMEEWLICGHVSVHEME
ncbi:gag-pol polyprotein [Tanacetum coccineum]